MIDQYAGNQIGYQIFLPVMYLIFYGKKANLQTVDDYSRNEKTGHAELRPVPGTNKRRKF